MSQATKTPSIDVDRLVTNGQLPALPQSAIRILELAKNPDNGPIEFAAPIEADPGLTSQVLRFVNSSYFGFSREISSVRLALTLVGTRTIKNFTLWSAVFSLMPNPRCGSFDLRSLWQDSLRRALFARSVAAALRAVEKEEAFAAALLQDMAVPLMAKTFPSDYTTLLTQRQAGRQRLSTLEQSRFGANHAEVGAAIARHWNLPEELAAPIATHADLKGLLTAERRNPTQLAVALSAFLPATIDGGWPDCAELEANLVRLLPNEAGEMVTVLGQVDRDFEEFGPVLKLAVPTKSLVQLYQETKAAMAAIAETGGLDARSK